LEQADSLLDGAAGGEVEVVPLDDHESGGESQGDLMSSWGDLLRREAR